MLERIAKLLAKAEAATTQEEAEIYFAKAQELATIHQISLAEAAQHHPDEKKKSVLTHRTITVGQAGKHVNAHLVLLFGALANNNDVRYNVAHNSTFVIAFGHSDDIDTVELMWTRIAPTMVRLAEAYLKTDEWRGETVFRAKKVKVVKTNWYSGLDYTTYEEKWDYWPITKQNARASYYQGFVSALERRLRRQRQESIKKVQETHDQVEDGVSTSLVLARKDQLVKDYYAEKSTARGSWRGASRGSSSSSRSAGYSDGSKVSLGGASIGGQRKGLSA